jgi:hypothetical protein
MRAELAPFGVSVVLVEPGVTDTPLYADAVTRAAGFGAYRATVPGGAALPDRLIRQAASPDDVAVIAVAATARRPRARYMPGTRNRFNAGLLATLPARFGDQDQDHRRLTLSARTDRYLGQFDGHWLGRGVRCPRDQ